MNRYIASEFDRSAAASLFHGDRLRLLEQIPSGAVHLVVTSPPYNIGKRYEKRSTLNEYLEGQRATLVAGCSSAGAERQYMLAGG